MQKGIGRKEGMPGDRGNQLARSVRILWTIAGVGIVIGVQGFTEGGTLGPPVGWWRGIPFMLWWSGPFGIYIAGFRTLPGSLLAGAGLVVATLLTLLSVWSDEHSTSGIGLLLWPVILYLGTGAALIVDRKIQNLRQQKD